MTDITISPEQVLTYNSVLERAVSQVGAQIGIPTDPTTGVIEQVSASTIMSALMMDEVAAAVPAVAADVQQIAAKIINGALQSAVVAADAVARVAVLQQDQAPTTSEGLISGTMSQMAADTLVIGGGVPAGLQSLLGSMTGQDQTTLTIDGGPAAGLDGLLASGAQPETFTVDGGPMPAGLDGLLNSAAQPNGPITGGGIPMIGDPFSDLLNVQLNVNDGIADAQRDWLAPTGTDFVSENDGDPLYQDQDGNVGDLGQMFADDDGWNSIEP